MNKVILVGEVCDEPSYKETDNGFHVLRFNVKTVAEYLNRQGEVQSRDAYHHCVAFGNLAKLRRHLHQWNRVALEGRLETRRYQDSQGNERKVSQVVANQVDLIPDRAGAAPSEPPELDEEPPTESSDTPEWGDDDIPF